MSAILSVRDLEKTFGSVVAARDITRRRAGRADRRHHRRQRRRQDHLRQHDHRPSDGRPRARSCFEGQDITGLPSREITRLGISRSFQVAQIFPDADRVREHVRRRRHRARRRRHVSRSVTTPLHSPEAIAEADAAIELFRIGRYRDAPAAHVAAGRAQAARHRAWRWPAGRALLLLDEPTSGISIEEKFDLMDVVMSALKSAQDHRAVRRARHGDRRALRRPRARLLRRHRDRRRHAARRRSPIRRCRN